MRQPTGALMIGSTLGHYRIEALLGEGGMGAVYRAQDTRLQRTVAIKILTAGAGDSARNIVHEARAASTLNHPNIVTVHSVERAALAGGAEIDFIVMECVAGEPLGRIIARERLPLDRAIDYARQIAAALAAAHEAGVVHRDVKPANVLVSASGRIKILDFGIARRTALPDDVTAPLTVETLSGRGVLAGTLGYVSPEQIAGQAADARSDVFAAGVAMYEMLSGAQPFAGGTPWAVLDATVHRDPPPLKSLRGDVPDELSAVVERCLAKDPQRRYASGTDLSAALTSVSARLHAPAASRQRRYALVAIAAVLIAVLSIAFVVRTRAREERVRWARAALSDISRLNDEGDIVGAYRLGRRVIEAAPADPQVLQMWNAMTKPRRITSDPEGATIAFRAYAADDDGWIELGTTPMEAPLPIGQLRWRVSKPGYVTSEFASVIRAAQFTLKPEGSAPDGMVYVRPGSFNLEISDAEVQLDEYWIGKFEVTNREYKRFVDAGGYRERKYWTQPFVHDGRVLSWDEAIARFRDATGRPGPSTWQFGAYPDGQEDYPVSGVSWYEAAAYAAFAGRSLPSVYHWYNASGAFGTSSDILRFSNFKGTGTQRVGASGGLGPAGAFDMAGNVKEWCWNEAVTGRRYVLGGAFNDASYQFRDQDARAPFTRTAGFGFRLMQPARPVSSALLQPVVSLERDPSTLKPVGDEVFAAYMSLYAYDPLPLDVRTENTDDSSPHWRHEQVSIRAAYSNDRVPIHLFLPTSSAPPFQVLVYMPGSDSVMLRSSQNLWMQWLEFVLRSGRAVALPVYQHTYERHQEPRPTGINALRTLVIQRIQDLRRTVDYLQSRPDVDSSRLAFYGLSLGAQLAPVALATEPRLRTGVLLSGGFETWKMPPEADPVNFTPRVRQPVLMVNGRDDFDLPYASAQLPMFQMLGTAEADKQHIVFEGGHIPSRPLEIYKVVLDWLDHYFGPVNPTAGSR
jgi:formylglycine-generating enzyme required for sulfatase activity/predicted esterase